MRRGSQLDTELPHSTVVAHEHVGPLGGIVFDGKPFGERLANRRVQPRPGQRQEFLGRFIRQALQQQLLLEEALLAEGRRIVPEDMGQAAVGRAVGEGGVASIRGELPHRPVVPGREGRIPRTAAGLVDVAVANPLNGIGIVPGLHVHDVENRVGVVDLFRRLADPGVTSDRAVACGERQCRRRVDDRLGPLLGSHDRHGLLPFVTAAFGHIHPHALDDRPVGIDRHVPGRPVSPARFRVFVGNLVTDGRERITPLEHNARRALLEDVHATEDHLLVGHRLAASLPPVLVELVAVPAAVLSHQHGDVADAMPEHETAGHLVEAHDDVRVPAHAEHRVPALVIGQVRVAGAEVLPVSVARRQHAPDHVGIGFSLFGDGVRGGASFDLGIGQRGIEDPDLVDQTFKGVLTRILSPSHRQVGHAFHALGNTHRRVPSQRETAGRPLRLADSATVNVQAQRAISRRGVDHAGQAGPAEARNQLVGLEVNPLVAVGAGNCHPHARFPVGFHGEHHAVALFAVDRVNLLHDGARIPGIGGDGDPGVQRDLVAHLLRQVLFQLHL